MGKDSRRGEEARAPSHAFLRERYLVTKERTLILDLDRILRVRPIRTKYLQSLNV